MASVNAPRTKLSSQDLPTDPEAQHDTLPPASGFVPLDEAVPDTIPAPPWTEDPAPDAPDSAAS
jgi:hypothetical protein